MTERETTFENAKVGDEVWSPIVGGKSEILEINEGEPFPIAVKAHGVGANVSFDLKGRYLS